MLGKSWGMKAGTGRAFCKLYNPQSDMLPHYIADLGVRPYFERSEFLAATDKGSPSSEQRHVTVMYPREYAATHQFWHETLNNLSIQTNASHMDGSNVGVWTSLATIDPQTQERSYSTTGYLQPIATRENLSIVTGAEVDEILFDLFSAPSSTEAQSQNPLVAKGVRYHVGEDEYQASASQEIILCAGSVGSPQILELSGIGNQQILEKAGIHAKIHNPNVGENLQEHIMTISVYELDDNTSAPEHDLDPTSFLLRAEKNYHETKTGFLTTTPSSMAYLPLKDLTSESQLASLAEKAHIIAEETTTGKGSNEQWGHHPAAAHILQRQFAPTSQLGQVEYVLHHTNSSPFFKGQVGKKYASLHQILQFPYSVGSVHVSSALHSTGKPIIDPKYYEGKGGDVDAEVMLHGQDFGDRIMRTEPLSSIITRRVWPPEEEPGHDLDWASWIRNNTVTDWHPVGTCSMLPLRAGGVVDHELRVYGTKNVRVIDASVFPLHISAHIQATIYAVAERGADIIKSTWEPSRNRLFNRFSR